MRISRTILLEKLQAVSPGLSTRAVVEQSTCFCFRNGAVLTFNEEIACRTKIDLDIEGAVEAAPLIAILQKLPDDEIDAAIDGGTLRIRGKGGRKAGIRMEPDVILPVNLIEKPGEWRDLDKSFLDAVQTVVGCAATSDDSFALTCVHLTPKWLEACDNFQAIRYPIATGIKGRCLIRAKAIRNITGLGMTKFSQTDNWMHFRNPAGVILSCRRSVDEYHDLTHILAVTGSPVTIPQSLTEAVDKAEIFSADNTDENRLEIELSPGKMIVTGRGASGYYTEPRQVAYDGPAMRFIIAPRLIHEVVKRNADCSTNGRALKIDGGRFVYVALLEVEDGAEIDDGAAAAVGVADSDDGGGSDGDEIPF